MQQTAQPIDADTAAIGGSSISVDAHAVEGALLDPQWQRRPEETARAFAAFCDYRDMGPARSLRLLLKQYQGANRPQTAPKAPPTRRLKTLKLWSRRYAWPRRTQAFDAHLELLSRREREKAYMEDLEALRARQKQLGRITLRAATRLLEKALGRLEALEASEIDPGKLPAFFRAAASVAETATNAEAVALGLHELITLLDARDAESVQ